VTSNKLALLLRPKEANDWQASIYSCKKNYVHKNEFMHYIPPVVIFANSEPEYQPTHKFPVQNNITMMYEY
jgi:hypothetical protein